MTDTPPREFTGRDLVEALQEAARSFGVRRTELGHEIIENYGVGARGCVIRAWPKAGAGTRGGGARPDADQGWRPEGDRPARADRPQGGDRPDRGRGDRPDRGSRGPRRGGPEPRGDAAGRGPRRDSGSGGGQGRRGDFAPRDRHDLPESASRQASPDRSRGGMYDDSMPARLSDRPPGQRDDRFRRGGGGFRSRDNRGGDTRGGDTRRPPRGAAGTGGRGGDRPERGGARPERGGARPDRGGARPDRGSSRPERAREDWSQRGGQARRAPPGDGGGPRPPRGGGQAGEQQEGRRRRHRPERGAGGGEGHPARARHANHEPPRREPTVPATAEHAAEVKDLLEEIVDRWGMELHSEASVDGDTVLVSIDGPDAERLAAEDGQLLDAVQYLLSKMTSRLLTDNVRVLLDAAGFRSGRDQSLRDRATAMAHEALDGGRKLRLDPLNPYERRVVHIALKEIPGIRTYSIGRGYLKRVTIEPLEAEGEGDDSEE